MDIRRVREVNDMIQEKRRKIAEHLGKTGGYGPYVSLLLDDLIELGRAVQAEDSKDQLVRVAIKYEPVKGNKVPAVHALLHSLDSGLAAAKEALDAGVAYIYGASAAEALVNNLNQIIGVSAWVEAEVSAVVRGPGGSVTEL